MGSRECPSPGSAVEGVSGGDGLWGPSQRWRGCLGGMGSGDRPSGGGVAECSGLRRSGGKGGSMGDEIAALPSALPRGPAFGVSMETEAPCGQATVHGGAGWAKWGTRTPGKWRALADFV
ncbi:unnamed protein product [Eretmochelys imbricata]